MNLMIASWRAPLVVLLVFWAAVSALPMKS
jgi:hypothetical protein